MHPFEIMKDNKPKEATNVKASKKVNKKTKKTKETKKKVNES